MNKYFRAIGFSELENNAQLQKLIKYISANPDEQYILGKNNPDIYVEYYKAFGEHFGLLLRGTMGEKEDVTIKHCYPYGISAYDMKCSHMEIEKPEDNYIVVAEEEQTGNELVFQLQNEIDYIDSDNFPPSTNKVNIVGMSLTGTIVLPVVKDEFTEKLRYEEDLLYRELMQKVRDGDREAQELLEIQENETSEIMHERLMEEDFLSVVEGFFIPHDDNEASYSLLGDIEAVVKLANSKTEEYIYKLLINVTGTKLEVYINELDLIGNPSVGMRFLGGCWLQGRLVY